MENQLSHIHLFGDPEENFFALGKKDKNSYAETFQQISMLCARNTFFAQILKLSTEYLAKKKKIDQGDQLKLINAYAQGLERPVENVVFGFLLPELVASFNKWSPQLIQYIPGCSSLLYLDQTTDTPIHTRILDYALAGPFEKNERAITYDFKNQHKTVGFSTSGMPFASLTGFNEKGLSLALHYKHGDYFNFDGESIFLITRDVLNQCSDIREAIRFLKTKKSLSYWGIILSDANGEAACVDINGSDYYQEKFDLYDHEYLYFNNRPLLYKKPMDHLQPYGNHIQCQMRRDRVEEQMKKVKKRDAITGLEVLGQMNNSKSLKNWKLAPTTPSSIQLVSMEAKNQTAKFVVGEAPKLFKGHYVELKNVFTNFTQTESKNKKKNTKLERAYKRWSRFQSYIDLGDISKAYHEIQMAELEMEGYPEQHISQFYFLVTEYIFESDKRDLIYLLRDFESLIGKLPEYLEDHCHLFILRLTKLVGLKIDELKPNIKNIKLKEIYNREKNLNGLALKGFKKLIFPRIEILDIIYAY